MNHSLILKLFGPVLFCLTLSARGQGNRPDDLCGAFGVVDAGTGVRGYKPDTQSGMTYYHISAADLRQGFVITLRDTSFTVHSFIIARSSRNKVHRWPVTGAKANPKNIRFLNEVEEGDLLSVECVTIVKAGRMSSSTSVFIDVVK